MDLTNKVIAVVGLGYVGLPLAIAVHAGLPQSVFGNGNAELSNAGSVFGAASGDILCEGSADDAGGQQDADQQDGSQTHHFILLHNFIPFSFEDLFYFNKLNIEKIFALVNPVFCKTFFTFVKKFAYSKTFFTFVVFFVIFSHQLQSQGIIYQKKRVLETLFSVNFYLQSFMFCK